MFSLSTYLLLALAVTGSFASSTGAIPSDLDFSDSLQDILDKAHQGPLYVYPTSLTQEIVPVRILPLVLPLKKPPNNLTQCPISERDPFP